MASPKTEALMASIPPIPRAVIAGVDTHKDLHVAAVLDTDGMLLGTAPFPTNRAGYRAMLAWMRGFGQVHTVAVEGTGSYGAALLRYLQQAGITVLEVLRPDRADRRRRGKDDTLDAENAARAALTGHRVTTPKSRDGMVEALRVLHTARASAVKSRRHALQLLRTQIVSAPAGLRDQVRALTRMQLIRTIAAWPAPADAWHDPLPATRSALRSLARRTLDLDDEIAALEAQITPLVRTLAPSLLEHTGFGIENTAQLLITCGDNPERLGSEARFAKLCGTAPLPASSGKTQRHRLNRGGDRQANSALHIAAITLLRTDDRTRKYAQRRTEEGKSKLEIIRCLKRYLAREAYYLIRQDTTHHSPHPA
jgi:transposase